MLSITNIRIKNFKSIQYQEIDLDKTNIFLGFSRTGKSNLVDAIIAAFSYKYKPTAKDFTNYDRSNKIVIDCRLAVNPNIGISTDFKWWSVLYDCINGSQGNESFAFRTVITYDTIFNIYNVKRTVIFDWEDKQYTTEKEVPENFFDCFRISYLRASDISSTQDFGLQRLHSLKDSITNLKAQKEIETKLASIEDKCIFERQIVGGNKIKCGFEDLSLSSKTIYKFSRLFKIDELSRLINGYLGLPYNSCFVIEGAEDGIDLREMRDRVKTIISSPSQFIVATNTSEMIHGFSFKDVFYMYKNDNDYTEIYRHNKSNYDEKYFQKMYNFASAKDFNFLKYDNVLLVPNANIEMLAEVYYRTRYNKTLKEDLSVCVSVDSYKNYEYAIRSCKELDKNIFIFADNKLKDYFKKFVDRKLIDPNQVHLSLRNTIMLEVSQLAELELRDMCIEEYGQAKFDTLVKKHGLRTIVDKYAQDNCDDVLYEFLEKIADTNADFNSKFFITSLRNVCDNVHAVANKTGE